MPGSPKAFAPPSVGLQGNERADDQRSRQLINPRNLLHQSHVLAQSLSKVKTSQCSSVELFLGA